MNRAILIINLPREKCLRYYRGDAKYVITTAVDGRRIQFPAEWIRPFITDEGVHGRFELSFDQENRVKDFRRL